MRPKTNSGTEQGVEVPITEGVLGTTYEAAIRRGLVASLNAVRELTAKGIELERCCRVAVLLERAGTALSGPAFAALEDRCLKEQRPDGGWTDVVETVWCTSFLATRTGNALHVEKSTNWLLTQRQACGGWGQSARDKGRIPITGLIFYLLPHLATEESVVWLVDEWKRESASAPRLTYKAAFVLLAAGTVPGHFPSRNLLRDIACELTTQQHVDGGWGPWRGHPLGSTAFDTGICLTGLCSLPEETDTPTVARAADWVRTQQLDTGLWPSHYIEEASAWCLLGLTRALKLLEER